MTYPAYLSNQGYSKSSIQRSEKHLVRFKKWLEQNELCARVLDYPSLLQYLAWERSRGIKEVSLRHYLRYVRWYYDYLLEAGKIKQHPLTHLNLNRQYKNPNAPLLHTLLSKEELEIIYEVYCSNPRLTLQNKVLLGLLIYQGLAIEELPYLSIQHLDLMNGRLDVPQSKNHQSRTLNDVKPSVFYDGYFDSFKKSYVIDKISRIRFGTQRKDQIIVRVKSYSRFDNEGGSNYDVASFEFEITGNHLILSNVIFGY